MTKQELIDVMANAANISKNAAARALGAFIEAVEGSLREKKPVALPGFGTFTTSERAARTGRNPQTGEAIQIPAACVPRFKPGKTLKDLVNHAEGK